jgi:hypothetical protein
VVVDEDGPARPAWAAAATRRPLRTRRVPSDRAQRPDWAPRIRKLAALLDTERRPLAVAALLVGPVA